MQDQNSAPLGANGFVSTLNSNDSRQNKFGNDQFCDDPSSSNSYCGMEFAFSNGASGGVIRGGHFQDQVNSGVFSANLYNTPTPGNGNIGFRCIYRP